MAARILKWIGIVVGSLAGLGLLLIAALYILNSRDEPLSPQAQALMELAPNPYAPEDNIYFAFAGFSAPAGESVTAAGQARVASFNARPDPPLHSAAAPAGVADSGSLAFKGEADFLKPLDGSLWNDVPPQRARIEQLRTDNAALLERYLAMHRLKGYYETARPSYAAPAYALPPQMRGLFLADLVLRLRSADPYARQAALSDLGADVRMWRAVLTGTGVLLSKMLAVSALQSDSLLVADLVADPTAPVPPDAMTEEALAPLFAAADWNIANAFAGEFRYQAAMLRRTQVESQSHFFKLQATENLFALTAARLMAGAAAQPPPPSSARASVADVTNPWKVGLAYNPIGKILASIAAPVDEDYSYRAWDAAALQRLVRLGYEVRRQRIDAAGIPAFMQQHPELATHPSDRRPFIWDPQRAEIRVQTVAKQRPGRRFSIRIWQPAAARPST
jgi:hypothetical protein